MLIELMCRVGLALVKFLMVELTHTSLNPKFNMSVVFMINYFFSGRRRPVDDSETTLLVIDFMNLKIKSTQSFKYVYRSKLYVYVLIE
jgi:hypothetical protein